MARMSGSQRTHAVDAGPGTAGHRTGDRARPGRLRTMTDVVLLVGTRKGLFRIRGDESRRSWEVEGPELSGWEVMHAIADPRDGSLYACSTSLAYGATVHRSTDGGETWERSEQIGLPEESGLTLEKLWHLRPGHNERPGELWLGGTPAVLFHSADAG